MRLLNAHNSRKWTKILWKLYYDIKHVKLGTSEAKVNDGCLKAPHGDGGRLQIITLSAEKLLISWYLENESCEKSAHSKPHFRHRLRDTTPSATIEDQYTFEKKPPLQHRVRRWTAAVGCIHIRLIWKNQSKLYQSSGNEILSIHQKFLYTVGEIW